MLLIYSVRCLFLWTLIGEKTWEDGNLRGIANRGHHKMGWAHSQNEKPEVSLSPLHQIPKFVLMELTENDRSSQHVKSPGVTWHWAIYTPHCALSLAYNIELDCSLLVPNIILIAKENLKIFSIYTTSLFWKDGYNIQLPNPVASAGA